MPRAMQRRHFLKLAAAASATAVAGCRRASVARPSRSRRRVLVLGFDGLDPHLVDVWIRQGILPNLARLRERGGISRLGTTSPPQSPVAWASFITGVDPSGHGIYDFIHRSPATYEPYLSTSTMEPASRTVKVGNHIIPVSKPQAKLLRRGRAFWNVLEDHGIPATICRVPSNFPPEPSSARTLSGLGTPDILGSYGSFTYFTDAREADAGAVSGGQVVCVEVRDGTVETVLEGPRNELRSSRETMKIPLRIHVDRSNPVARLDVAGRKLLLAAGEWSEWVRVGFDLGPIGGTLSGICRFLLKSTRPLGLYASPINIDPSDPALPITTPDEYAGELARAVGPFYTQGMAEDTKALSSGILSEDEFLEQAERVFEEQSAVLSHELERFEEGVLFAYFSSSDLVTHMYWRAMDRAHPLWTPSLGERYGDVIEGVYRRLDEVLGEAVGRLGDRGPVFVISDHGFAPFRRAFDLNAWLTENGYLRADRTEGVTLLTTANWVRSGAYGMGFNGLYVNESGRESQGSVMPGPPKEHLLDELQARLTELRDPNNGAAIFRSVRRATDCYNRSGDRELSPDLVLGYNRGYRGSWETALGDTAGSWLQDNLDKWSGDHCMDASLVPGVIASSVPITADDPELRDLAPTLVSLFGIDPPAEMSGKPLIKNSN